MSEGLPTIPEVARKAAEAALCGGGEEQYTVHVTHGDVARAALDAAAPLIVAAELERLVAEAFPNDRVDYHYALEALYEDICSRITELTRAAELRGGGS